MNRRYYKKVIDILMGIVFLALYASFLLASLGVFRAVLDFHSGELDVEGAFLVLRNYNYFEYITLGISLILLVLEFVLLKLFTMKYSKKVDTSKEAIESYQMEYYSNKKRLGRYGILFVFFYLVTFFLIFSLDAFLGIGIMSEIVMVIIILFKIITTYSLWRIGYYFFYMILFKNLIRYS